MIKRFFLLFMLVFSSVLILESCRNAGTGSGDVHISGEYLPYGEKVFISRVTSNNVEILDSVDISEGLPFSLNISTEGKGVFRFAHKELYPLMVIAEKGDTVTIRQTGDPAWPYRVTGSPDCMLLVNYLERLNRDHAKVDSLSAIFHSSQNEANFAQIREQLNEAFIRIHEGHKDYARNFVTLHPASIASVIVVNGFFKEFALFDQHEDFQYYEIIDKALMEKMPGSRYAIDFHSQVENIRAAKEYELEARMRLSPGRVVPDFALPGQHGNKVGPKDFNGHNLLIYFWAATDAPSRQANKIVKDAFERYNRYGLQVLAISFDKDASMWEAAIDLDGLPGIHATDLKGAGSPVQKLFNLKNQLPAFFLIDTQGRIFDHDRDFGKLHEKIVELFKEAPEY